jgi:hypothetical protein
MPSLASQRRPLPGKTRRRFGDCGANESSELDHMPTVLLPKSLAIRGSIAKARAIAANEAAVAHSCQFHIYVMRDPISSLVILYIILVDIGVF